LASRRTALGGAVLFLALAAPAAASAATISSTVPCARYISGVATMGVRAAGFTPNTALTFSIDGSTVSSGIADAAGNYATPNASAFSPPFQTKNIKTVTVSGTDTSGVTASSTMKVVKLGVVVPGHARPSRRVRYRAFGFAPGKRIYLFVRRGGKTKGRFTIGKAKGACGTATKKLRYMPLTHYQTGTYQFWYSHDKKYSKATRIYGYSLGITRTFR
jgi:hypothetical protein